MKVLLTLMVGCFLLTSCVTYNKCVTKFGLTKADTVIVTQRDTVEHTTTVTHTDTVHIGRDTIKIVDLLPYDLPDSFHYHREQKGKSGSGGSLSVDIKGNKLTAQCNTDSLLQVITDQQTMITRLITVNKKMTITPPTIKKPAWYQRIPLWIKVLAILFMLMMVAIQVNKIFQPKK
jgi:hypothetical protein